MPKVLLRYEHVMEAYEVFETWDWEPSSDWEVVLHLKASTVRRFERNAKRVDDDQEIMRRLFIEAQMAGREICER